tara:strand:+ start:57 stop:335 length:279 start_codon:yes stop_codon:yes gene_type:complete
MKNYLKNKKTKITNILHTSQDVNNDHEIELCLWKNGDLYDMTVAKWFTGDYIDLDRLNKQINKLVDKYKLDKIELKYPHEIFEFDHFLIFEK